MTDKSMKLPKYLQDDTKWELPKGVKGIKYYTKEESELFRKIAKKVVSNYYKKGGINE